MIFRPLLLLGVLLTVVIVVAAKDASTAERKLNIDPALRKALLRALRHLKERQEEEKQEQLLGDANTTEENFATTILDELLEESTVADSDARVRDTSGVDYHTFVANAQEDDRDTIEGEVEQRDTGAVTIGSSDANEIIKTIIIAKPKATLTAPKLESENEIVPPVEQSTAGTTDVPLPVTSSTTQQPPVSTTTGIPVPTTPAPTHNEDGENIEQVKSEDVKIFQAPLVAAFTVQQDQLGVPRNVIPLLQTPPKQKSPGATDFKPSPVILPVGAAASAPAPSPVATVPLLQIQAVPSTQPLLAPLAPPSAISLSTRALEEKTRQLEQQLFALQNQQRAQEQLLRAKIQQEQAIIQQQQQQLQQQKQRLEEETRLRIQRFEQEQRLFRQQQAQFQQQQQFQQQPPSTQQLPPFKPQPLPLQQQPLQQQQAPQPTFVQELPRPGPAVQFIPSVSLPGGKPIPISVEQQLPFKEAVDFQPQQPPQQQQQVSQQGPKTTTSVEQVKAISQPPQLAREQALPLKPFQPFNLFPVLPPLLIGPNPFDQQQLPPLQQRNRVFRQEPVTGNFGLNVGPPQQAPFRPSQPLAFNGQTSVPLSDSQNLQNLLFQSGITSRSAEDFNIITKVLALNHGIPQASSQRMFAKLSPDQQRQLLFRK
uniref:Uncharacterized protein n=1 Tax=Anopheles funestus TaxID=62324 RepID=A0A182RZ57_ANOFN